MTIKNQLSRTMIHIWQEDGCYKLIISSSTEPTTVVGLFENNPVARQNLVISFKHVLTLYYVDIVPKEAIDVDIDIHLLRQLGLTAELFYKDNVSRLLRQIISEKIQEKESGE